jgi:hypothetical protein
MFGTMFTTASRRQRRKRHGLVNRLSEALDAYASHRMQMAVSEFEQRRAKRVISQMRRSAAR